jgi:NADPH-dependent ferric siderophore reductase
MAKSTEAARRIKPQASELLTLHVIRRQVITPNMSRVTLGSGDIAKFVPMGFDQWFRLFIPIAEEETLSRLPQKLNTLSYAKYLTISKTKRPVLRNYTVRAYREVGTDGPELDIDFVLHGDAAAGTAGPAASWAARCEPGDAVAILDEGIGFVQPVETDSVVLVADETGLPAVATRSWMVPFWTAPRSATVNSLLGTGNGSDGSFAPSTSPTSTPSMTGRKPDCA